MQIEAIGLDVSFGSLSRVKTLFDFSLEPWHHLSECCLPSLIHFDHIVARLRSCGGIFRRASTRTFIAYSRAKVFGSFANSRQVLSHRLDQTRIVTRCARAVRAFSTPATSAKHLCRPASSMQRSPSYHPALIERWG
jgi:hypothetical protein